MRSPSFITDPFMREVALTWAGAQDNGVVRGGDATGASQWLQVMAGDGGFTAIDPKDPNMIYGESQHLSLRRSVNGGASFVAATNGITEKSSSFPFIAA